MLGAVERCSSGIRGDRSCVMRAQSEVVLDAWPGVELQAATSSRGNTQVVSTESAVLSMSLS